MFIKVTFFSFLNFFLNICFVFSSVAFILKMVKSKKTKVVIKEKKIQKKFRNNKTFNSKKIDIKKENINKNEVDNLKENIDKEIKKMDNTNLVLGKNNDFGNCECKKIDDFDLKKAMIYYEILSKPKSLR